MGKIITISRQYGSGGREIGAKLAERLDIPFYDKELITRAAMESGFAEETFENAEKKATNSLLYSIAMGLSTYGVQDTGYSHLSLDNQVYLVQSNIIRKVAMEGPCVIVGRGADYILREMDNVVNVYIWADFEQRKKRAIEHYGLDKDKAVSEIKKIDKARVNYYNYHSGKKWGWAENYHLCIKSDFLDLNHTVDVIAKFVSEEENS